MSNSLNIARMLNEANQEKSKQTADRPDAATHPAEALQYHRSLWPLNQKVADGDLPEMPEGSDRVRMRRAAAELADNGISMDGSFANNFYERRSDGANLIASARFGGSGEIWSRGCTVVVKNVGALEQDDLLRAAQQSLQRWGFSAVVDLSGNIVLSEPGEEEVCWAETGLRPTYHSPGSSLPSPQEALRYHVVLKGCRLWGGGVLEWASSPFSPQEAREWAEAEVTGVREAQMWQDKGVDVEGAKRWREAGWGVHHAREWIDAGYRAEQAEEWSGIVASYSIAREWIDAGYDPEDVRPWTRFSRGWLPANVAPLIAKGIDGKKIAQLQAADCTPQTIDALERWTDRYKIDFEEALQWAELGPDFVGPGKRGRWHKAGFQPDDIRKWQRALGSRNITLEQVIAKQGAGFDPDQTSEWLDINHRFSDSSLIAGWTQAGLGPDDAKPWTDLDSRLCHYSRVGAWQDHGFGPDDVKPWAEAGIIDYFEVAKWQAASPLIADNPKLAAKLLAVGQDPEMLCQALQILEEA